MADQDELSSILDRILAGDRTEADIEKLRQSLRVDGNVVQLVSQDGKFNTNIGEIEGGTFHIGDVYYGADSEKIEQIFLEILSSQLQKRLTSPTVDTKAALILDSDWLLTHLQKMENEFVEHMCSIEESTATQATDRYVELLVQERKKVGDKEQEKAGLKEGSLSQFATRSGCRLLVFGEGGSGKTTSLLKLAADAAVSARTNSSAPIPFYVKLNFFDTSEKSFEQLLRILGETANLSSEEVNVLWQQGQRTLLFLLDGFNEVGQSFQDSCRLALEKLMWQGLHLYVITSRPTVEAEQLTKQIRGIKVLDILQLLDDQMKGFLESHGADQIYEYMGNQLKGLVRNPFMLWALVQSCSGLAQGELPRNKGQLYQNFIDRYIFSEREASKVPPPTRYDYERVKRQILAQLAYQMTDQSETRIVLDDALEDHVINWLEAINTRNKRRRKEVMPDDWSAEDFLNETVLNGVLRQFRNTLEFMHQSVQNYFVAVYLDSVSFDHADFYKCLSYISWDNTDNVWDEVITFFSGITSDLNKLIETLIEQDLFLAASCAGSRPETLTSDVITLLFEAIDRLDLEAIDNSIKFYGSWWEKVIAAYKQTLALVEEDSAGWAILQAKLGLAYTDRIFEKTVENLETAIQYCQAALKVFTPEAYPEKWADIQNNLGNAYRERIRGEWQENLEQAIHCYQLALRVRNRESLPIKWAVTQRNLGETCSRRIRGDRADNLEQAIECYQLALQVFAQELFPQRWAETYINLGSAFCDRIRGDRADNLEQAIECYQLALKIFTQESFTQRWAEIFNSLGSAYCNRIRGDRADNLEQAIECYRLALLVFSQEAFPRQWAECLNNLSNAYGERIRGDKAENLEQAIHSLTPTLEVFTLEDFPQQWAKTLNRMGNTYRERIREDRAGNLERSINAYERSLQVRTRDALPLQWAETIANLGNAYWERIRGDRADNLEQSIEYYQQALTVRTRDALPLDWATTMMNLATAYSDRVRGDRANNSHKSL
jgi:tetratricopeptide (TPR) repeat protein